MKKILILVCGALAFSSPSYAADGKQTFLDNNCNRCHAVSSHDIEATVKSERMRGPDMSDIGERRDVDWLVKYVRKEVEVDGKAHRASYNGTDEDLKAIADWLATLEGAK